MNDLRLLIIEACAVLTTLTGLVVILWLVVSG